MTRSSRGGARIRRWTRPRLADDRGSLIFAMLLMLVGISLTALLVPMVATQISGTREEDRRIRAGSAAQSGLNVALGHIQAAQDGAGAGIIANLPCGPLTGTVGVGGGARYQVTIDYLQEDPKGFDQDLAWIANKRVSCIPGGGTPVTPYFALLRSSGTDQPAGAFGTVPTRDLVATYVFQHTNQNISGGLIHVFKTGTSTDLCFDAGSGSPPAGANLIMSPCSLGDTGQTFAYNKNLTISLVASRNAGNPLGMCLDAGPAHSLGAVVRFQVCDSSAPPQQQWSSNDAANLEGTSNGTTLDNYCFNVQTPNTSGSFVVLGSTATNTCHRGHDNIESFSPDASAGAGAAGVDTGQVVSFSQFGRCIDVTNQQVTWPYLIAWPCKQAPDPTTLTWNQVWAVPVIPAGVHSMSGQITTNAPAGKYCLQSPLSTVGYVLTKPCATGAPPADQTWTVYGNTGAYLTSYRVMDSNGYCLSPTDPAALPPDLFVTGGAQVSKIVVAVCGGSTLQKWNADPNILTSLALSNIGER